MDIAPRAKPASLLASALTRPECYPHPVHRVTRLETHISWVFLTGLYAYKIKKPLSLGFLDFSSLEARRHYCEEELRLNRRLAAELYLDTVEIRGSATAPRIGGTGRVIEHAVRMREFPQDALASRVLARGALTAALVARFGERIARFHEALCPAPADSTLGTPGAVLQHAYQNFDQVEPLLADAGDRQRLASLRAWTEREFVARHGDLRARHAGNKVRECHGDLHLGNIVLLEGELVPFDCIEFNAELRWNDVMSEVAFTVMDLMDRSAQPLACHFLDAYLESTGDYTGLAVLRFYLVYRAMVRAKIHLLRSRQAMHSPREQARLAQAYRDYIALAETCACAGKPALIIMHGLAGCGKSTLAQALALELGAIRIRSDIERKRLAGLSPLARSSSVPASGLYTADATRATYARLAELARAVVAAGYPVVLDAAFLQRWQRQMMQGLAAGLQIPFRIISVQARTETLRERVAHRAFAGIDASEATAAVLAHQMTTQEPLSPDEQRTALRVDGEQPLTREAVQRIAAAWIGRR